MRLHFLLSKSDESFSDSTIHLQESDCGFHYRFIARELCKAASLIHPLHSASTLVGQQTLDSSVGIPIHATEAGLQQGLPAVNYSAGISIVSSAAELDPLNVEATQEFCVAMEEGYELEARGTSSNVLGG